MGSCFPCRSCLKQALPCQHLAPLRVDCVGCFHNPISSPCASHTHLHTVLFGLNTPSLPQHRFPGPGSHWQTGLAGNFAGHSMLVPLQVAFKKHGSVVTLHTIKVQQHTRTHQAVMFSLCQHSMHGG